MSPATAGSKASCSVRTNQPRKCCSSATRPGAAGGVGRVSKTTSAVRSAPSTTAERAPSCTPCHEGLDPLDPGARQPLPRDPLVVRRPDHRVGEGRQVEHVAPPGPVDHRHPVPGLRDGVGPVPGPLLPRAPGALGRRRRTRRRLDEDDAVRPLLAQPAGEREPGRTRTDHRHPGVHDYSAAVGTSAGDAQHPGVQDVALVERAPQRPVDAVLEVQLALPLDDVGEHVAVVRRVVVEQHVQAQGRRRGDQVTQRHLGGGQPGPLAGRQAVVRIGPPVGHPLEDHGPSLGGTTGEPPPVAAAMTSTTSAPVTRASVGLRSERGPLLLALMLATALVALDSTIIATAVPSVVDDLGGFSQFPWLFSVYLLAQAVSTPVYGRLADVLGRKPVMLAGISLFLVGSVLCAVAWSMPALIVFRAVQGLGAGAVLPMSNTIAGDVYSLAERAKVQGYLASVWGVERGRRADARRGVLRVRLLALDLLGQPAARRRRPAGAAAALRRAGADDAGADRLPRRGPAQHRLHPAHPRPARGRRGLGLGVGPVRRRPGRGRCPGRRVRRRGAPGGRTGPAAVGLHPAGAARLLAGRRRGGRRRARPDVVRARPSRRASSAPARSPPASRSPPSPSAGRSPPRCRAAST